MNYIFYKEQFLGIEKAETEILWRKHPEMNHSKKFFRGFENARSKRYFGHNRNQLHVLTGFLTGHCRLRKSLMALRLSVTVEIRFFGEKERFLFTWPCHQRPKNAMQIFDFIKRESSVRGDNRS